MADSIGALHQFEIKSLLPPLGEAHEVPFYAFTNSALAMAVSALGVYALVGMASRNRALVPGRWQALAESLYEFIAGMVRDNVGSGGRPFFPFIFTLFMFIIAGNLLGLIPWFFTFTSSLFVTFTLAAVIFVAVTTVGFMKHGLGYFRLLFPEGAPIAIAPVLVPVELISYLARPVSLSVRLFANMTVGHVIFKVLAFFTIALTGATIIGGIAPFAFLVGVTVLEIGIAVLQAYIFTILACIYLHDALHMH